MNDSKLNHHRSTVFPLLTLLLATAAGVGLVISRVCLTGHLRYLGLIWNLFLAWLPLVFALGVCRQYRAGARNGWKLWTLAGLWLLFFPNAPYIFTDLIHLNYWFHGHYWSDLAMILLAALTGFLLGFVSLYLMQSVVADRLGRVTSWLFILVGGGIDRPWASTSDVSCAGTVGTCSSIPWDCRWISAASRRIQWPTWGHSCSRPCLQLFCFLVI